MSHEELKVFTLKLLTAFRKTSKYVPQPRPNLSTVALVFNDGTAELARREEKRRRLTEEGLILGEAS